MSASVRERMLALLDSMEKSQTEETETETVETGEAKIEIEDIPTPYQARVDKYIVNILEVHKINVPWDPHYLVACKLKDGGWESNVFHVKCNNAEELAEKIIEEIQRYEATKRLGVSIT